ncbi:hypothetical protein Tco_1254207 [Tanacetum coccineum]
MTMMRASTPSTYILAPPSGTPPLLPIPLPTSSPPLLLPSTAVERMFPRTLLEGFRGTPEYECAQLESEVGTDFVTTGRQEHKRDLLGGGRSMDASNIARSKTMALRTTMLAQQVEIRALRIAHSTRQTQLVETLTLLKILQTQMTAL